MLPKKPFGSSGIDVSIIGLGTVKLGRDQGVKYPQYFTIPNDIEAANLIAQAQDLGINLIDTAPSYGNSEVRLGKLLSGQRNQWIICSKVGEEFEAGQSSFDFSPKHTRMSIERSLKRLKTSVIDILLVHSDGNDEKIIQQYGTLETLADLKAEGKIRAFGMSTKTVAGGLLAAEQSDGVMVTWNLDHNDEIPVIDYCFANNKGVFIKKAFASGHTAIATQQDPVQQSFQMIFNHPGVSSAIVGTINLEHLQSNAKKAKAAIQKS